MANNITIIVDNLASLPSNPYTYFNTTANKYYTYYAFSASTIVSADISASETFGEDFNIVSLPNIDSDVYAIRAEIEEYYYEPGEASARTCTYSGTVCAKENLVCTNFEFDIEQKGCPSGPAPSFVTVSFNLNGHGTGPAPSSQTIEAGGYATKPIDPAESGYYFNGWFDNQECSGGQFSFKNDVINSNITLYAAWCPNNPYKSLDFPVREYDQNGYAIGYIYTENPQSPEDLNQLAYFPSSFGMRWSTCIISNDIVYNSPRSHDSGAHYDGSVQYPVGSKQIYSIYMGTIGNYLEFVGISINHGPLITPTFERVYDMPGSGVYYNVPCICCEFSVTDKEIVPVFRRKNN